MPHAIEIENLSFQYPSHRRIIFSNFSWKVGIGDFWVIIGANGSGKTSLIRLLLGLESPTNGLIRILGNKLGQHLRSLNGLEQHTAKVQIGYVPQHLQFDHRLPIPVWEVVEGGVLCSSFWKSLYNGKLAKERADICQSALGQVGMASYAKERFSSLSGGQKQRVLIARALASESPILILDEPTASVDPTAAREIVQICQQLRKKHTILFVSHDIGMIPDVCEYILCLNPATANKKSNKNGGPNKVLSQSQGAVAHSHDVRGLSREDILLLLYGHWGFTGV